MAPNFRKYCAVYGCLNSNMKKPDLTFFKLPSEPERLTEWLRVICREDLAEKPTVSSYRVCEEHFNPQEIMPTSYRKLLKRTAVPSLQLPNLEFVVRPAKESRQTQTDNEKKDSNVQTTMKLSCDTPRKRKLKSEIAELKKKLKLAEQEMKTKKGEQTIFHKLCDKFLTKELALLVKAQTYLKIHGKGNRYDQDYLIFCLNLYFTSPQAYQLLQTALCLPCTTTLYKYKQPFPITTELNERAMSILKIKIEQMTEAEKVCSVMIDTMSLKANLFYDTEGDKIIGFHEVEGWQTPEPAKDALVIMVRGIFVDWEQPVAFALLSESRYCDEISKWVDNVLQILFEIGLNIRTFVSGQGSDSREAAKERLVSIERPYFFINDRKIYYIFDAPQLINNVRDNLMKYDFHFGDSVAKFEHIQQFYNQVTQTSCRLTHKLTNSHIQPTNLEKTKVCYAAQLLSKSVASGISTYIDNNIIEDSGRDTAKFLTLMNDLFDILNTSDVKHSCEYKRAYTGYETQNIFFREMLKFFQDLKIVNPETGHDCTSSVTFIEGFQITITSLMLLFDDLRVEGLTSLYTRRLNQDSLVNLFDEIRKKVGMNTNPTSRQFISAFKKIYFCDIMKPPVEGNTAYDLRKILVEMTATQEGDANSLAVAETTNQTSNTHDGDSNPGVLIASSDYNQLDIPEQNTLFYICAYLLKRCREKHSNCAVLKAYVKPDQRCHNFSADSRYSRYRDYSDITMQSLLIVPCDDFVEYVEKMENIYQESFQRTHISCKLSVSIYSQIKDIPFPAPCACFPKKFLIMLFIRMRIFYTLKFNNKAFRTSKMRRKIFSVVNL